MHRLQWDDLQYVLAVAEAGSLSSAARILGVHHATVLRRISTFEAFYGIKIFERGAKGYHLSPESSHILSTVRNIDDIVERLSRTIAAQGNSINGSLRITTTDVLCSTLMIEYSRRFNNQYPDIQLEVLSRNDKQDLSKRESDIAIRICNSLPVDLAGSYAGTLNYNAYATKGYIERKGSSNDVSHHDWLGLSGMIKKTSFASWMDNHIPAHNIVFRADSFLTLASIAETDYGIAILPCCLGDASEKLIKVDRITPTFSRGIWIVTHPDLFHSVKIQMAISFFVDALKRDSHLLMGNIGTL